MNDFANTLLQLFLYILRIITPFFALLIIYQCFSSLRNHRRQEQPLITLGNLATRDLIPVIYWENSIGRGKTCDIRLGDNTVSRDHAVLYRREDGQAHAGLHRRHRRRRLHCFSHAEGGPGQKSPGLLVL